MKTKNDWTCLIIAIIAVALVVSAKIIDNKIEKHLHAEGHTALVIAAKRRVAIKLAIERAGGPANYYKYKTLVKNHDYRRRLYTFIMLIWFAGFMVGCLFIIMVNSIKEEVKSATERIKP